MKPKFTCLMAALLLTGTATAQLAPASDDFAHAQEFPADYIFEAAPSPEPTRFGATLRLDFREATAELGEPAHGGVPATHSRWFTWTAPADGGCNFELQNAGGPLQVAVYSGERLDALTPESTAAPVPWRDALVASFQARRGVTYRLAVNLQLTGRHAHADARLIRGPANDHFDNRLPLSLTDGLAGTGFSLGGCTREADEPSGVEAASVWFSLEIPEPGAYQLVAGANAGLFRGETLAGLVPVRPVGDAITDRSFRFHATARERLSLVLSAPDGFDSVYRYVTVTREPRYDPTSAPRLRLSREQTRSIVTGAQVELWRLGFSGRPHRLYQVETSSDLKTWLPVRSVVKSTAEMDVDLADTAGVGPWFRLVVPE